jgi:hypothetical protein
MIDRRRTVLGKEKVKMDKLNLVEARDEFIKLSKAFRHYTSRVKHLGGSAALLVLLGDDLLSSVWSDAAPGVDLLLAAANEMARDGDGPNEIKETFEIFSENVVMAQRNGHVPTPTDPFSRMTATIDVVAKELAKAFADMDLAQHAGGEQVLIELFGGALRGVAARVIRETKEKVK